MFALAAGVRAPSVQAGDTCAKVEGERPTFEGGHRQGWELIGFADPVADRAMSKMAIDLKRCGARDALFLLSSRRSFDFLLFSRSGERVGQSGHIDDEGLWIIFPGIHDRHAAISFIRDW